MVLMTLLQRRGGSKCLLGLRRWEKEGAAEPSGRHDRAAVTVWPFLKWCPLFPLQKCLTRKKPKPAKPKPQFLWCPSALGVCIRDQMLLVQKATGIQAIKRAAPRLFGWL